MKEKLSGPRTDSVLREMLLHMSRSVCYFPRHHGNYRYTEPHLEKVGAENRGILHKFL